MLLAVAVAVSTGAPAQVREPGQTKSAGEDGAPLGDVSRPMLDGSNAVHDAAQTLGETSSGSMRSAPVHELNGPSMLSGPVSSMTRGPVSGTRASLTAPAVDEASTGAVTHDNASPLGERISEPLTELGPLRARMREQRDEAARVALQRSMQPAVPDSAPAATLAAPEQHADAEVVPDSDGLDPEGDLHGEDAPAPDDSDPAN